MRGENVRDPVYAPNSKGGPAAEPARWPQIEVWEASGEFVHAAYTKRRDDDDFVQPGTLVRPVTDDHARDRPVSNVVGHLRNGVRDTMRFGASAAPLWQNSATLLSND
jgi:catalase